MKKLFLIVLFLFCAFALIGCQSSKEKMTLFDNITKVSVSKSEGYGGLNENYFTSLNNKKMISSFEEVMKGAKRKNVDVNKEKPDYDILVQYEDGNTHGLHLLMGNEGEQSVFMYIGNEETTFYVSPEGTKKLRQVIK